MQTSARIDAMEKGRGGGRKRIETVVATLATLGGRGESLSEVAHDARNMVTALGLYCDLLEEPGVLTTPYQHYGTELRLVASASRRLVEKLVSLDAALDANLGAQRGLSAGWRSPVPSAASWESEPQPGAAGKFAAAEPESSEPKSAEPESAEPESAEPNLDRAPQESPYCNRRWDLLPAVPVANLAAELLANRNLLAALAGPSIALTIEADGGSQPVRLTGEDLTRILVNLVKNAAEAMPGGGRIHIGLGERPAAKGAAACLLLNLDDNGPGIPPEALETIFDSGYSTRGQGNARRGQDQPGQDRPGQFQPSQARPGQDRPGQDQSGNGELEGNSWPLSHRGLGLAITRSIVEGAGGRIAAQNRAQGGARFVIELPIRETWASTTGLIKVNAPRRASIGPDNKAGPTKLAS